MARGHSPRAPPLAFDAITVEGALISPAMLARIARHEADQQTEADYAIPKGLTLRDEIARYFRIGQALHAELAASPTPSVVATIAFVEKLLRDVFGFVDLRRVGTRVLDERTFIVTLEGLGGRIPVVVVPPADDLDRPSDHLASEGRRRSAASALQDWLNANTDSAWGLCSNGVLLRLVRRNASLTRPAYIEAGLRRIVEDEAFADFTALWLLVHASRFGRPGTPALDCALERWRDAGQKEGIAARDRLRDGVEASLLSLGTGFLSHPDNGALREGLRTGALPLLDFFGQLLRLVYRFIFLFVAEDRNLLHPPVASAMVRKLYANGYSLAALRDRAVRRSAWDRYDDHWEGLLIAFAGVARGEPRLGLPALGGLFGRETIPDLEAAKLANRSLMEAIYRLAWLKNDSGLVPVNWRDMETEELGSVYESLLELTPRLDGDMRRLTFAEGGEAEGHARKTTGSYYTPDSLVQLLLDSALDPVLDRVEAETSDPAAALLSVTILDPACGSGHFLLAAARRIATRLARTRAGGVASPADFRHAVRDVVRSCIHGVDRNPMAVELTKVALWIETVEPGKPLGFLDANIRGGDSLLGLFDLRALAQGVPDAAYKPLAGDDKETAKHFAKRNDAERKGQGAIDFTAGVGRMPAAAPIAGEAKALRAMPEDSLEEVAAKRQRLDILNADPRRWNLRTAADLYTAAFLAPKIGGAPANRNAVTIPTTAHVWDVLAGRTIYGPLVGRAQELATLARAFHWPLEFPDVMAGGGFDVVLGNPPWERIKLLEQEFFAAREPEIAEAPNASARGKLIAKLKDAAAGTRERVLYEEFESAKRNAEASSGFARVTADEGGRFPLTGRGDVNTYALFAELFAGLSSRRGRAGVIVPTGIATDDTYKMFFGHLVSSERLHSLMSFYEIRKWFQDTDDRKEFSLVTIAGSRSGPASFVFSADSPQDWANSERRFTLSAGEIARINPNTKTAPVFRSRADAQLTAKIYSQVPVLIDETMGKIGNSWGLSLASMFHMSNDSGLFRTSRELAEAGFQREGSEWVAPRGTRPRQDSLALLGGRDDRSLALDHQLSDRGAERYVPLYEGKMIHHYDHRYGDAAGLAVKSENVPLPRPSLEQLSDRAFEISSWYYVSSSEVRKRRGGVHQRWLLGWRDITNRTAERTVIACALPETATGNNLPIISFETGHHAQQIAAFYSNLCSIVLDFVARHKVGGTHLNYFIFKQLAVLPPSSYTSSDLTFIFPRVLELTFTSYSMIPFARDLGYDGPPFAWEESRRAQLRAELDAFYARAYGLTRDELRYILDPADVKGTDYPSETFRVLKKNEIVRFGEYRTARLVLQAWDRLERGEIR